MIRSGPRVGLHTNEIADLRQVSAFPDSLAYIQPRPLPATARPAGVDSEQLRQLWHQEHYTLERGVQDCCLNPAGTLFGGNLLHWAHVACLRLALGSIPNLSVEDIYTPHFELRFRSPVFAGEAVRIFPQLERQGISFLILKQSADAMQVVKVGEGRASLELARTPQPLHSSQELAKYVHQFRIDPWGLSAAAESISPEHAYGKFYAVFDAYVCQLVAQQVGHSDPNPVRFVTRLFACDLSAPGLCEPGAQPTPSVVRGAQRAKPMYEVRVKLGQRVEASVRAEVCDLASHKQG
jgi:hypothetical protein